MAQLNIAQNQEGILQLIESDRDTALAKLLQESLNTILKAESMEQLEAAPYERSEERTGSRNGFHNRPLTTRIGQITLKVPKHRNTESFKTFIFDNYCRSEGAWIITTAEMVVNGVSTHKVSKGMETLCGKSFFKSAVSQACFVQRRWNRQRHTSVQSVDLKYKMNHQFPRIFRKKLSRTSIIKSSLSFMFDLYLFCIHSKHA